MLRRKVKEFGRSENRKLVVKVVGTSKKEIRKNKNKIL